MSTQVAAKSPLSIHRILSPRCGARVSAICFGSMGLGEAYSPVLGHITKEAAFELLDFYYQSGGNFIDIANNYQNGESEEWVGQWMESRGIRDQIVIATKYTMPYMSPEMATNPNTIASNHGGNHAKSLHISVRDSLRKLRTDYIDIMYVHWWDYTTGVEEVMRSLNNLVVAGKVLYLGVSDSPAWVISKANQYARDNALSPFVVYSGLWNVMTRDLEREIIPMCLEEGMAVAAWGVGGQGRFKTKAQVAARGKPVRNQMGGGQSALEVTMTEALEKVGEQVGASVTAVAIAYLLQRCPYVFPIVGGQKIEHLRDNIKALQITLSPEQVKYLESQAPFDPGFPYDIFGGDARLHGEEAFAMRNGYVNLAWVRHPAAIRPAT